VINDNLDTIFHRYRDVTTYSLKLFTKNCDQTAADRDMITIDSI